jgi:cytoskeleton protein RodZ
VTDDAPRQVDAFITPGTLLKAAREEQGISEREAADRLNLMPGYVAILERDDYQSLRSPPFARGYVKAYGKLLGLDEEQLLFAFDQLCEERDPVEKKRVETRPLQLQHTGLGVVIGLAVLCLLVLGLWWWQADAGEGRVVPLPASAEVQQEQLPRGTTAGEL